MPASAPMFHLYTLYYVHMTVGTWLAMSETSCCHNLLANKKGGHGKPCPYHINT